jgi:hypothetical protein
MRTNARMPVCALILATIRVDSILRVACERVVACVRPHLGLTSATIGGKGNTHTGSKIPNQARETQVKLKVSCQTPLLYRCGGM